jgi:hypothetical protein
MAGTVAYGRSVCEHEFDAKVASRLRAVTKRYRCSACGNLTRFDVVAQRRTRAYHHFSVGGELHVEDEVVLEERIEEVLCRWCGNGNGIETIDDSEAVERAEAT